jgi:hypothetical protein
MKSLIKGYVREKRLGTDALARTLKRSMFSPFELHGQILVTTLTLPSDTNYHVALHTVGIVPRKGALVGSMVSVSPVAQHVLESRLRK